MLAVATHQEATIEGLATLPLDSVVGRPSLGGICSPAGLSLSSRGRGDRSRVGIGVNIGRRLRDRRGRQRGRRVGGRCSGSAVRGTGGDLDRHSHRERSCDER